jgi:tRNA (cytidine/uridine-2'-O-)-methyltransferase
MFDIAFVAPQIAPNTGNAIRLAAATGCRLHVIGPLGFEMFDARLRRAGLDYHELAQVVIHQDMTAAWTAFEGRRVFAFTGGATCRYTDVRYEPGDVLMFGTERTGLSRDVLEDRRITERVRLPMLPGLSMKRGGSTISPARPTPEPATAGSAEPSGASVRRRG